MPNHYSGPSPGKRLYKNPVITAVMEPSGCMLNKPNKYINNKGAWHTIGPDNYNHEY
jgi:hypothetical protein